MLGVVRVGEQLGRLVGGGPDRDQAQRDACGLARDRTIGVQHVLDLLEHLLIPAPQRRQAQAQARPVLRHLQRAPGPRVCATTPEPYPTTL